MRGAVLRQLGAPLSVEELDLDPPRTGEVLVRIEAAGVCHSDLHYMTGDLRAKLPIVMGHEGAGVVEAVGPGVGDDIGVGDRVALLWRPRCGACDACIAGNPVLCRLGRVFASANGLLDGTTRLHVGAEQVHHLMGVSCFAERVVVSQTSVLRVPDEIPPAVAAVCACAAITGVGAAMNAVRDGAGRPLAVFGAGGVGLCAVMGAAMIGADPIIAVDIDGAKLALARKVGATYTIDAHNADAVEEIREITGGGAAWIIDAVGQATTMQQAVAALRPSGTLIAVGLNRTGATFAVPLNELVQQQKHIVGALYGASNPRIDLPRIFALYLAGKLPLDDLITSRRALSEVNEAFADLRSGAPGRTVVLP